MPNTFLSFVNWLGCSLLATCTLVHSGLWSPEMAAHFLITFAVGCELWSKSRAQRLCTLSDEPPTVAESSAETPAE